MEVQVRLTSQGAEKSAEVERLEEEQRYAQQRRLAEADRARLARAAEGAGT